MSGFINEVLEVLHARTGVDFTAYRPAMLERRILNRMSAVHIASEADYFALLQSSAVEPARLLEKITIKVSRLYRHAPTFNCLRDTVLPALIEARRGAPLRIWCAGCGTGEEPYTLAMLLVKAGIEGTIVATDIDDSALAQARAGLFELTATSELPPELTREYLEPVVERGQPRYQAHERLRSRIRFARHDVTSDVPPTRRDDRFDLVSCRNVLIYLQPPAQTRAVRRLIGMTRADGVLCLGEAEWPQPELSRRLVPLSGKTRLFRVRPEMLPDELSLSISPQPRPNSVTRHFPA
jgi:two-component system CheB/CheR fusion protein